MGKQTSAQGRSTPVYATTCLCAMLVLLILIFEAAPLSFMWSHHLQNQAASPFASTLTFLRTHNYTGCHDPAPPQTIPAAAFAQIPPLIKMETGLCTCSLHLLNFFNPNLAPEVLPQHLVNCSCPSTMICSNSSTQLPQSSFGPATEAAQVGCASNSTKPETVIVREPCLQPKNPKQGAMKAAEEPWYARGRSWHPPPRFPRCTMDACFNYSRCEGSDEMMVYTYNQPAGPVHYFKGMNQSRYSTDDPDKACLFFVFLDTPGPYRADLHPSKLPYWQGGLNHVLITFGDKWLNKAPAPESIGYASAMATAMHQTLFRPGFDVSIALPAKRHFTRLRDAMAFGRKYLLTFRGMRYLQNDGVLRSFAEFRGMHNGDDVVVVTSCRHPNHKDLRRSNASLDEECRNDEALYDRYDYVDLMNSTFGLAPAGRQPNSYRFAEILSAGSVPVVIADNYVKPFSELVQWHRCILQFPSTEMHRILKTVRSMRREEVERRQKYCLRVYARWFAGATETFEASMEAQKARFMGVFSSWSSSSDIQE